MVFYLRQQGSLVWNSYPVAISPTPSAPFKVVTGLDHHARWKCMHALFTAVTENCAGSAFFNRKNYYSLAGRGRTITALISKMMDRWQSILSIYPNTNNGHFMIDINHWKQKEQQVRIEIINIMGQTLLTNSPRWMMITWMNPSTCRRHSSGTYFARVTVGRWCLYSKISVK